MIKQLLKIAQLFTICYVAGSASAAMIKTPLETYDKEYIFIENNVDKEYFIAPALLDPRFTGSNVWNKYKSNQTSLGYMGVGYVNYASGYADYWIENSPINHPYRGQRCQNNYANCPASGFLAPESQDSRGVYKLHMTGIIDDGYFIRPSFAPAAYEYFKNQTVGTTEVLHMNACTTLENYSPESGKYCKDATNGIWRTFDFKLNKKGHVSLLDTKAFQEVWYGTDGTPYLTPNGTYCQYGTVPHGTADQQKGVMCKMLKYNTRGMPNTFSIYYFLYMVTDNASLGFTPAAADLRIHGGAGDWKYYSWDFRAYNQLKDMLVEGDGYISVFFSNSFFKKLAQAKVNIRNIDNLFTFAVDNNVAPQSGYYQFSVSTKVELIPREYSVSIQPKGLPEGTTPVKSGKINDSQPITFDYVVKQSAPRQADTIVAYVNAPSVMQNGESYCSFKSDDNKTEVPIPAWLSIQNNSGQEVKQYSGCNINSRLNLSNAFWYAEPWDSFGSGYFFTTDLRLAFPMDNEVSQKTTTGVDWMGTVREEGEIRVDAQWNGVTFP